MKLLLLKVFRDLAKDKFRTILSLLAMLVGTSAFGIMLFTYFILDRELVDVFVPTQPSSANIMLDRVEDNLIQLTKNFEGIGKVEEKAVYPLRIKIGEDKWKTLYLYGIKDFKNIQSNKISSIDGSFNPGLNEVLIERDALGVAKTAINENIVFTLPDSSIKELKVVGSVNDIHVHPASMHQTVYAYVSFETLAQLGLTPNRLDITLSEHPYNREHILSTTRDYMKEIVNKGYAVSNIEVSLTPGQSPHKAEYNAVLFIIRIFSGLAFVLGCMIITSLLSTILTQQVKQIGILKAIGAKTNNIFSAYLCIILLLVAGNIAISLPLSSVLSQSFSKFLMRISNMDLPNSSIPNSLLLLFALLALFVPLVIAFIPIRKGVAMSVKDSLNSHSSDDAYIKEGPMMKWATGIRFLSRPIRLSIRNAVKRKGRFYLNIVTLTFGGALFIAVVTSIISLNYTIDQSMDKLGYDYEINTKAPVDSGTLDQVMQNIPEIKNHELWGGGSVNLINADGRMSSRYHLLAPPFDTKTYTPDVMEGRWLKEGDTNEVVIGYRFFDSEPSVKMGDEINVRIGEEIHSLHIVGIVKELGGSTMFINKQGFDQLSPAIETNNHIKIMTSPELVKQDSGLSLIEEKLEQEGINTYSSESKTNFYTVVKKHSLMTMYTFLFVAIIVVIVGAIGLTSTMSIQVVERTKEIGIMKAIGSTTKQIKRIITAESIFIALISWSITLILGIPIEYLGSIVIGNVTIKTPLTVDLFSFILPNIIWFVILLLVGYMSSIFSSRKAAKMKVKETLVFE
ncbi:FtsX-like permease family protein [Paenibacillus sp. FSL P4-0338]|uniref:ABC transporter permease n=1 Tax=unclassified Paenibacillus TaxID=185978 RepID=UPI0003E1E88A|nr:FtsX-like permease family protein [Paenibacillus sp. FSL R7-269]ETT49797.1 hypothetical protein C162_12963 [Paenibacillus sp. FSL R7-269]